MDFENRHGYFDETEISRLQSHLDQCDTDLDEDLVDRIESAYDEMLIDDGSPSARIPVSMNELEYHRVRKLYRDIERATPNTFDPDDGDPPRAV